MSFHPNDLVSDVDLLDYEADIIKRFGQTSWLAKQTKALEDWLFPILKTAGYDPYKLRTRYEPDAVFGFTGSVYTDLTSAAKDTSENDLALATILATVSTDALYIGSVAPFRGLFFRFLTSVSAVSSLLHVSYWNGNWDALTLADGTIKTAGKTFSGGGSVSWLLPSDWSRRVINSSAARYWVKLTVSATPTGASATQVGCIRASSLRAPVTLRTLSLIMREALTGSDGPWDAKATYYETQANDALQRALQLVAGEIDTDDSDEISAEEAAQTAQDAGGTGGTGTLILERY